MKKFDIAGIDFSLSSPAICIANSENFSFENCKFFVLSDKKRLKSVANFNITSFVNFSSEIQRYDYISSWALEIIKSENISTVFIEDYSFGSTGRVFNIAENAGLLKYKLYTNSIPYSTIPPTVIKKYACGKGNAKKEQLFDCFLQETGINVRQVLELSEKNQNPTSDLVDSYYIAKYGSFHKKTV